MSTLVLAFHHAPEAVAALRAALDDRDVEVHGKVVEGLSSAYHAYAARMRQGGRILPAVARDCGAGELDSYERVVVVSWSAPYALVEDMLGIPADAAAIAAWVALDSGYGLPTPGVVDLARRAIRGEAVYLASYTDVATPYPSSKAFLDEVRRQAGEPAGGFDVEHVEHDPAQLATARRGGSKAVQRFWEGEHVRALRGGPARLVDALDSLDELVGAPKRAEAPTLPEVRTLGLNDTRTAAVRELQELLNAVGVVTPPLRVDGAFGPKTLAAVYAAQDRAGLDRANVASGELVAWLRGVVGQATRPGVPADDGLDELSPLAAAFVRAARADVGVREDPKLGHNRGTRIDEYNRTAGVALGSDYCAPAIMTWLDEAAKATGIRPAIKGSPAAKGFEAQLRGTVPPRWFERGALPGRVRAGWVLVFDRPNAEPWQGHAAVVERVEERDGETIMHTVEANAGPASDQVLREQHTARELRLRGGGPID